jgi:choice-of-anchor B domain-containing protein
MIRGMCSDVWGYTSPTSGYKYAIYGCASLELANADIPYIPTSSSYESIFIVNVTESPVFVQKFSFQDSKWFDIKTYKNYAYIVSDIVSTWSGHKSPFLILDLSDIDGGHITDVTQTISTGNDDILQTHNIAIHNDILYRCNTPKKVGDYGAFLAYNLSENPLDPPYLNADFDDVHDAHVLTIHGDTIAFLCTGSESSLKIVNVTDIYNMQVLSDTLYLDPSKHPNGYSHQVWVKYPFAYLNDELIFNQYNLNITTFIFNVSDLRNPTLVNEFDHGLFATSHNMYIPEDSNYAFQANYEKGLRVYDLSNPVSPNEVAYSSNGMNDEWNGLWGVYPFFDDGTIIGTDILCGLYKWTWRPQFLINSPSSPSSPPIFSQFSSSLPSPPSIPPVCSPIPAGVCAGPTEFCFLDPSCETEGGLGCNAAGHTRCRFCGFGIFNTCPYKPSLKINSSIIQSLYKECCENECWVYLISDQYQFII